MWDRNWDTMGLEQLVASCKELTAQRSYSELAAVLAASEAALPSTSAWSSRDVCWHRGIRSPGS